MTVVFHLAAQKVWVGPIHLILSAGVLFDLIVLGGGTIVDGNLFVRNPRGTMFKGGTLLGLA